MKILHVNAFDLKGGAARAAHRIHSALRENGIDSTMMVGYKKSSDEQIREFQIHFQRKKIYIENKLYNLQKSSNSSYYSLNLFSSGIHKEINCSGFDIVHFHWIGLNIIGIREFKKITIPIVWTMHDMWPFCGTEHYQEIGVAERYKEGYCSANRPSTHRGILDVDKLIWKKKQKEWKNIYFHLVAPSRWLAGCAEKSALFSKSKIEVIQNCIDIRIFSPKNKKESRKEFGLDLDNYLILFGADGGGRNHLKGFHVLKEALRKLSDFGMASNVKCIVFGSKNVGQSVLHGIEVTEIGRIDNDLKLSSLYNAVDLFVIPSIIDNLPNTIMESMSCGTPCVGFATGGIPDMIDHKMNGFLAIPFDPASLAEGIYWVLSDEDQRIKLGRQARDKVENMYSQNVVAMKYIALYKDILKK